MIGILRRLWIAMTLFWAAMCLANSPATDTIWEYAKVALIPPAVVLALGLSVYWIIMGARRGQNYY